MWPDLFIVGITGPESTGKTTLAASLARSLQGVWIPEFARLYLEKKPGAGYSFFDFLAIGRAQMQHQILLQTQGKGLVILDADHTVIKIWALEKYGHLPPLLEELYDKCRCDLHLLCYPDLPWQPDPLRESPHIRLALFEKYEALLKEEGKPYAVIKGTGLSRLEQAKSLLQLSEKDVRAGWKDS